MNLLHCKEEGMETCSINTKKTFYTVCLTFKLVYIAVLNFCSPSLS